MAKNLEARIALLEAQQGSATNGSQRGRQLARLAGYEGAELDAKASEFSAFPFHTHEEWIDILAAPTL